ncbi:MAG: FdrA family protein [Nakamurella sp.]
MTQYISTRRGAYRDSVTLLRMSQAVAGTAGIVNAQVAMATPLNIELAVRLGFSIPGDTGPNDLLIAIDGVDQHAIDAALADLERALTARGGPTPASGPAGAARPRTVRAAASAHPDASLVLLSVPGPAVLGEAMDAIDAGRHLMIFSDNVPITDEVAIKTAAGRAGVLVMGPDCGTALIAGVGYGFANVLRGNTSAPRVGVVAASGTGAQQLICLLDDAGVAVSHVLGVGGRDLSEVVAGRSAITALRMLDDDPGTDHIVLISKPPHPATAEAVGRLADSLRTPVSSILIGPGRPDITAGTEALLDVLGVPIPAWQQWGTVPAATRPGALRGLYSGGTLAGESISLTGNVLGHITSTAESRHGLPDLTGLGHVIIDLGDDEFTVGRPHPMIDPSLRIALLAEQAIDPTVAVLLLDVVLGHAADPDPAARLAPAISAAIESSLETGGKIAFVISLCGTAADPQDREAQAAALTAAGATVFASNAAAARTAAAIARGGAL